MSHKKNQAHNTHKAAEPVKKPTVRLIPPAVNPKVDSQPKLSQEATVLTRSSGHPEPIEESPVAKTEAPILEPVYPAPEPPAEPPVVAAPEAPRAALEAPRVEESPPMPRVHRRNRLINTPFGLGARVAFRWMQATGSGGSSSSR